MPEIIETEVLVVGSGIAGLSLALRASSFADVLIVTKKELTETNTNYAQGGIAAALSGADSSQMHIKDTLICGDGLSEKPAVEFFVSQAPAIVRRLESLGANFAHTGPGKFDLGLEGGHSARRIVHAQDFTGREIERALAKAAGENPKIKIRQDMLMLDLILAGGRAAGAVFLDVKEGRLVHCRAGTVVLATGGAGKVYLYTTNPEIATGDGMAAAWRCGLTLKNLEFVQFHPTCLHHPKMRNFLISEAVRGEGAVLKNQKGVRFMKYYDERQELAPRDTVARAIDAELKKTGDDFVYLDISHKSEEFLKKRFPNIFEKLLTAGINMAKDPIPVIPAAHYFCGGVKAEVSGKTDLAGLYAIGEVACTGFHGANRLASNSLLEACAMAHCAVEEIQKDAEAEGVRSSFVTCYNKLWPPFSSHQQVTNEDLTPSAKWGTARLAGSDANALIAFNWDEVRRLMASYVGIVRSEDRLRRAAKRLAVIRSEVEELAGRFTPTRDLAELLNIVHLSGVIVQSALSRKESRGLHYMLDYPGKDPKLAKPTEIKKQ